MKKVWKIIEENLSKVLGKEKSARFVAYLKYCWMGEELLWKVFWLYGIAISIALSVLFVAPLSFTGGNLGESIALLITLPYYVWVLKSTWQCADNIESDEFKGVPKIYLTMAAKICVIFGSLNFFLKLFG